MLELTANGAIMQLESTATITDLIQQMGLGERRLAVELNGDIVPRSLHTCTQLSTGDCIEIVVAVGGG